MSQYLLLLTILLISYFPASDAYGELWRPGYHFTPAVGWMNDPNGLVHYNGTYHLYYQYNPYDSHWGNMNWGHATSSDLVHWTHHHVAIPMYNGIMIFSGSVIIDVNNTSGFCQDEEKGCMIAYYTQQTTRECQGFAYSNNGGYSYTQYRANPVIDLNMTDFRDPKVFWYEPGQKWVMVVSLSSIFKIRIYSSKDLINWDFLSDFDDGFQVSFWEDPDLFNLTVEGEKTKKWILTHSIGSYETVYNIGEFNGTHFVDTDTLNQTHLISIGFDFSEATTYNNEPKGRRLMVGWMSNPIYGEDVPTEVWRGAHTLIRELKLRRYPEGLRIIQEPIEEYQNLRHSPVNYTNISLSHTNNTFTLAQRGLQYEICAEFVYPNNTKDVPYEFGITVYAGNNQTTLVGYDMASKSLFIDRTNSGLTNFSADFPSVTSFPMDPENGKIQMHIYVDQSSVEVFGNNGKVSLTNLIFPDPTQDLIQVYTIGGSVKATYVNTWLLKGVWPNSTETDSFDIPIIPQKEEKGFIPLDS